MTQNKGLAQKHPQEERDRPIIDELLEKNEPNDENLADLARLQIRYCNFPGAQQIKEDLQQVLNQWGLTEEELYAQTRRIHSTDKLYQRIRQRKKEEQQDWS